MYILRGNEALRGEYYRSECYPVLRIDLLGITARDETDNTCAGDNFTTDLSAVT